MIFPKVVAAFQGRFVVGCEIPGLGLRHPGRGLRCLDGVQGGVLDHLEVAADGVGRAVNVAHSESTCTARHGERPCSSDHRGDNDVTRHRFTMAV